MVAWPVGVRRLAVWSYGPLVVIAIAVPILIAWAGYLLWQLPYVGIDIDDGVARPAQRGQITAIDPAGPLADLGLVPGDVLLAVDQVSLDTALPTTFASAPGQRVELRIQHAQQVRTVAFTSAAPGLAVRIVRIEPIVIAVVYWGIALVIWILRPFDAITRLFFLIGQVTAGMLVFGALSTVRWPTSSLVFNVLLLTLPVLALHFCTMFPEPLPFERRRRWLEPAYIGLGLTVLVYLVVPVAWLGTSGAAALWLVRRSLVVLVLLATLVLLFRHQPILAMGIRRRRRLLISGMVASFTPLMFLSLVPEILSGQPLVNYPWTFPFLILLPIAFAYSLQQGELGKIDLILNRSLVYLLLTMLLFGSYTVLFLGLRSIFASMPLLFDLLLSGGSAVAVGLVIAPLRVRLQRWVDSIFYGGWYDYRSVVMSASMQLSEVQSLSLLVERTMSIARSMRFQEAAFLWREGEQLVLQDSFGYGSETLPQLHLACDGKLVQYLAGQVGPRSQDHVRRDLALADLAANERLLVTQHVSLWLPIGSHARMNGLLVTRRRDYEVLLDQHDLDILTVVGQQAGMASQNVVLLDALRIRLREIERVQADLAEVYQRLAKAQEAEQLNLARELHDTSVQQLLGVTYQLIGSRQKLSDEISAPSPERNGRVAAELEEVRQEILAVITQLRTSISNLRPAGLEEFGLGIAFEGYVARLQRDSLVPSPAIMLDIDSAAVELPHIIASALFRVLQEALRNALKHADARQITIQVRLEADEVVLELSDDGRGFEMPAHRADFARTQHFGIIGMAERVAWLSGTFAIQSCPTGGTIVTVRVPITERKDQHE